MTKARRRGPRGKWTPEIRARCLALLRETGNASEVYRRIGHRNMFRLRRKRHPDFARDWAAAEAEADARLRDPESAFLAPARPRPRLPPRVADPATLLRPAPKKKPRRREHVIRKIQGGRTQIALAPEAHMTAELEAEFIERLRITGNFSGSARAIGFHPSSLLERARRWPAFKKDCDEALAEASVKLDYALIAHAHKLLRDSHERREDEEEDHTPFDPDKAIRILCFLDRRKHGRTGGGPRKGPPERTFEEAVASVLAKIEAIERHKKWKAAQEQEKESSPPLDGEG